MKKLNEKRDELAQAYQNEGCIKGISVFENSRTRWAKQDFEAGFDAALAELMPMMLEMCEAIRYVMAENDKVKGWDKLHDVFYKYKELVGE